MTTTAMMALATGLPVVATDHSGFPEMIAQGRNGFLGREGDPQSIANAIIKYFECKAGWGAMSAAARAHVLKKYDQNVLMDEQLAYYRELITN